MDARTCGGQTALTPPHHKHSLRTTNTLTQLHHSVLTSTILAMTSTNIGLAAGIEDAKNVMLQGRNAPASAEGMLHGGAR
jgi:hypothetical protein